MKKRIELGTEEGELMHIADDCNPCTICMIAYANYFTDARIKNYVDALLKNGYQVDVFALGQPEPAQLDWE